MSVEEPGPSAALGWYYRALSGHDAELVTYPAGSELLQYPDTAAVVRLPERSPSVDGLEDTAWYRVALAHRALHDLLGSFAPELDLPTVMDRYPRALLAGDLYAVLEDVRVDAAADRLLPGLRADLETTRAAELAARPQPTALPARAAVAEALVQYSLGAAAVRVPVALLPAVQAVARVAAPLRADGTRAEDSLAATAAVYRILTPLRNAEPEGGPSVVVDLDAVERLSEPASVTAPDLAAELLAAEGEILDLRLLPVGYRDVPGPRYRGLASTAKPPTDGLSLVDPTGDDDIDNGEIDRGEQPPGAADAEPGTKPTESPPPTSEELAPRRDDQDEVGALTALSPGTAAIGGALTAHGRDEYVYPEWDAVARAYRTGWCLVRTSNPAPVRSLARYRRALARHGALLPGLQRAVDRVRSEGRDVELRRRDGDDLDLDACVEAVNDLRAGLTPTDRVHASMVEGRRDVAVAIAVDLSASTAQAVPPDPDRPGVVERILDVESDAVILLIEVLERMGDAYGVWAFSGAGRDDVRLGTVKSLDQPRSAAVLHRLAGLVPDHTTRMAPAVRHLTAELARHPARTKILLMISDGRPYDIDYGQEYGEQAILPYALADTARSFAEARASGVWPYLVTVDPSGADYLGRVCDPREYHVIDDARELPAALAQLYTVARSRH